MIDTRLIGPKDDQYAVLSLGTVWLATTKAPYAEAVSAAIAAAIAGGGAADAAPPAIVAHSKTEYKRLKEQGANVLPPSATAAPPVEETAIGNARYEYLRTLNPRQFAELWNEALNGLNFDYLVDRHRMKGEPVDHGYDRTASLNAGHYVCTCGGGRNRHHDASQPSPTTKEQP